MNEVLAKLYQMFLSMLTSILSTLLISAGLFCISWYLATEEFPPKIQHVKEKYSQYREMIKLSQIAMDRLQSQTHSLTQNPLANGLPPNPSALMNVSNVSQEEWMQLNARVQKLEQELQELKRKSHE